MKQLYFIALLSVGAIISMHGADDVSGKGIELHVSPYDGSFYGQMLQDHPSYDFVGMQGDSNSEKHSIAVRKKGHEDEWGRYRHYTMCTFNKWGKAIDYHNQDGGSHFSGSGENSKQECKDLQELYNKFNTTYQAQLALNRERRRAELALVKEDLIAAQNEERRASNRVDHLIEMYKKLQNSLPD